MNDLSVLAATVVLVRAQWPVVLCGGAERFRGHEWRIESDGMRCDVCAGFIPRTEWGEYNQWCTYVMTVTLPLVCAPWRWN